jgi:alanyl-tRNA synthetase
MLGNFSFGDYWKEESIYMGYELVTQTYGINLDHLIITVHPDDQETQEIWSKYLPKERIILTKENIWSSGTPGILGKCTEFFYDFQPEDELKNIDLDSDRFLEFYNIVFIDSRVDEDGQMNPLDLKCIDSGLGLERLTYILGGFNSVYDTFDHKTTNPVIKDHLRTCGWIIEQGVKPSNSKHGYVLRKLMRRMFREGYEPSGDFIFTKEYQKYKQILKLGEEKLNKLSNPTEQDLLNLYQTFGIPVEISKQILNRN